jgi:acetyl-CoA carboxylase biotin carboxyl carrier protein
LDIVLIETLVQMLQGSEAEELTVAAGELQVRIRRGHSTDWHEAEPLPDSGGVETAVQQPEAAADNLSRISAGMVGIFHPAAELKPGTHMQPGQVIGVIESMKQINEVISPDAGAVREVLVEDRSPVEFGQVLVTIEKGSEGHAAS